MALAARRGGGVGGERVERELEREQEWKLGRDMAVMGAGRRVERAMNHGRRGVQGGAAAKAKAATATTDSGAGAGTRHETALRLDATAAEAAGTCRQRAVGGRLSRSWSWGGIGVGSKLVATEEKRRVWGRRELR